MICGRNIICIGNRWDYDPTSKHHVMRALADDNRILWVNYRGTRKPGTSAADLTAVVGTLRDVMAGAQRVDDSLVQMTPLVFPGVGSNWGRRLNRTLLTSQIRRALGELPPAPVQLWTFAPDVDFLIGQFNEECSVYYCVDQYSKFEDLDENAIHAAERRLLGKANVVLTTSQGLFNEKKWLNPNTHLVRHGVDVTHFAAAMAENVKLPASIADLPGPIYGFFGLLHHWIDIELLAETARSRPAASFVLIGDAQADVECLRRLPNVHLVGRKPYAELPRYCAAFDAALLPFRMNEMTRYINPIKLREYLAAGLPVVSTPLPEAIALGPDVLIAESPEQFAAMCDQAVADDTPAAKHARSARVADQTWQRVTARISRIVNATAQRQTRSYESPADTPLLHHAPVEVAAQDAFCAGSTV